LLPTRGHNRKGAPGLPPWKKKDQLKKGEPLSLQGVPREGRGWRVNTSPAGRCVVNDRRFFSAGEGDPAVPLKGGLQPSEPARAGVLQMDATHNDSYAYTSLPRAR
jgi:hypothetical protein